VTVTIEERCPTPGEYVALRASVGWAVPDQALVSAALAGSIAAVVACSEGEVVGMGRVVGDGALYSLLVDLVVHPDHRGRGLGRQMLAALERAVTRTGGRPVLNVVADPDVAGYYLRLGYDDTGSQFLQRSL
jgi:GNAT superfamily N-acetyltransferase